MLSITPSYFRFIGESLEFAFWGGLDQAAAPQLPQQPPPRKMVNIRKMTTPRRRYSIFAVPGDPRQGKGHDIFYPVNIFLVYKIAILPLDLQQFHLKI